MTAFNLAVCIAPSLLWLPNPSTPEAESEFTRKVSVLVQFLIENYCTIFGEDLSLLYASLSAKDNREDSSDICSLKHIDSSYDSLENELNDDGDSPYSGLPTKMSHENRSRDSVLTLSDCDMDQAYHEEVQNYRCCKTSPVKMSAFSHHRSVLHEQSENESLCSNTSGYSSTTDVRRHRRCSEPVIGILASRFSQLNDSPQENNSSCDALLSQSAEDYLKQHRYLQVEGQKLINRSLTLGIDVSKTNSKKQTNDKKSTPNRLLPPSALRLNICSRVSCSSWSSPGTSPSGSSLSSLDSAFSHFSDFSVINPNEVPSNLDYSIRQHTKLVELSPDFLSVNSLSVVDHAKQPHDSSILSTGKSGVEWPSHKGPVSTQPITWLKNGKSAVKNSKKKDKAVTPGDCSKTDGNHTTKELTKSEMSECSFFVEQGSVPKLDCETKNRIQRPKGLKDDGLLTCTARFDEETGSQKLQPHMAERCLADKNGNGEKDMECNAFLFPSPVSINIELSPHSQDSTLMPQTFFFSENIALLGQRNRRKSTNSYILEEPMLLNSNLKSSSEHSVHQPEEKTSCSKEETAKTSISRDISILVTGFKKNKVLPANVETGAKIANCDLVKNFCVSPKLSTSTRDLILQSDLPKPVNGTEDYDNAITQTSRDWSAKRCSDPKFDEIDQRFFTEESYV